MQIEIPKNVNQILEQLEKAGYPAYIVGGCVRDSILGRRPTDWDVTTKAKPFQVKELFRRTIDTGIEHGTVTIMIGKEGYEVTTYRIDGLYEDSRHPKEVTFTEDLKEDLRRRDFTINAMAYNRNEGLIDVFGGKEDMKKQWIRAVGNPRERFQEDALRMMRALRFSAQLGYEIENQTKKAIIEMANDLEKISAERIQMELLKLLVSPHPEMLKEAYDLGVTKVILPEFDEIMFEKSQGEKILQMLRIVPANKIYRLVALFHKMEKSNVIAICKRLKMDNATIKMVGTLVSYFTFQLEPKEAMIRKAIVEIGQDAYPYLYVLKKAKLQVEEKVGLEEETLEKVNEMYKMICERKDCLSLQTMNFTGKDLLALGLKPGKKVGEILYSLFEIVLEDPKKNTKEELEKIAKNIMMNKGE
jgi:tRNA nucleotidyltransferase (CCA-adding enzyme)